MVHHFVEKNLGQLYYNFTIIKTLNNLFFLFYFLLEKHFIKRLAFNLFNFLFRLYMSNDKLKYYLLTIKNHLVDTV